jgi:hypothetical protein
MADYPRITGTIRPTPRNRVSGFLADLLELGAKGYDVGSTLQAGGPITEGKLSTPVSDLLGIPELQRTLNRVSYNEPLTTGTGYTTRLRPDTVSAAMTVAPMVGPVAKAGAAGARMTGTALKDLATSDVAYNAAMNAMRRSGGMAEIIPENTSSLQRRIRGSEKNQLAQKTDFVKPITNESSANVTIPVESNFIYREAIQKLQPETQKTIRLFHGSPEKNLKDIKDKGLFGGIFANRQFDSALSHGENLYYTDLPESSILQDFSVLPQDKIKQFVKNNVANDLYLKTTGRQYANDLIDLIASGKGAHKSNIPEQKLLKILKVEDLGDADWELQRLRGKLAQRFGYKAVEMPDEHGISHLVLPGASINPVLVK